MNVRPAGPASEEFVRTQDDYLRRTLSEKGITDQASIPEIRPGIKLWRGDITLLKCDAIVNAANSGMTGCYVPCHACIDNCIHTYSGIQLREECAELMRSKSSPEPTGTAEITKAYNLPCKYVIHTVGPIVEGRLNDKHRGQLVSCYRSCLELAAEHGIGSLAFCCISTGLFRFPNDEAALIAVRTAEEFRKDNGGPEVIFKVFKEEDEHIYRGILSERPREASRSDRRLGCAGDRCGGRTVDLRRIRLRGREVP